MSSVAETVGEIVLSPGAMKRYEGWYRTRRESRTPFLASFESREDSHVLRLAAVLAVNDDYWQIQANHITKAIQVIAQVKYDGSTIFAGGVTNDKLVLGIDKAREKLIEKGLEGIGQAELALCVRNYLKGETLRTVLAIMHELDMVQQFKDVSKGRGRPVTVWRATKLITAHSATDALYRRLKPNE